VGGAAFFMAGCAAAYITPTKSACQVTF